MFLVFSTVEGILVDKILVSDLAYLSKKKEKRKKEKKYFRLGLKVWNEITGAHLVIYLRPAEGPCNTMLRRKKKTLLL